MDLCRFHAEDYIDFLQRYVMYYSCVYMHCYVSVYYSEGLAFVDLQTHSTIFYSRVTPHNISGFTASLSRFNVGDDW